MVTLAAIFMVRVAFESIDTTAPVPRTIVIAMTDAAILACIISFIYYSFTTNLIPYLRNFSL